MATYNELFDLKSESGLKNRIAVAATIKAAAYIALASPTEAQLQWAAKALTNPEGEAAKLLPYVLAANASASVAQITGATDAAVQTNVNAAVDKLVTGGVI